MYGARAFARLRARLGRASPASTTSRPTIARAIDAGLVPAVGKRATVRPARITVIVSEISVDLVELVRDEDDRAAIVAERAQHAPELLHLGRREHGRRLVENQNARAAHERLQNLHALLLAHAQLAHVLSDVHAKAAALRGRLDLALRPRHVDREPARGLATEDDVLGDR